MEILKLCKFSTRDGILIMRIVTELLFCKLKEKSVMNLGFHGQLVGSKEKRNGSEKRLNGHLLAGRR